MKNVARGNILFRPSIWESYIVNRTASLSVSSGIYRSRFDLQYHIFHQTHESILHPLAHVSMRLNELTTRISLSVSFVKFHRPTPNHILPLSGNQSNGAASTPVRPRCRTVASLRSLILVISDLRRSKLPSRLPCSHIRFTLPKSDRHYYFCELRESVRLDAFALGFCRPIGHQNDENRDLSLLFAAFSKLWP